MELQQSSLTVSYEKMNRHQSITFESDVSSLLSPAGQPHPRPKISLYQVVVMTQEKKKNREQSLVQKFLCDM